MFCHSERSEESPALVLHRQSNRCGDSSHTLRVAQNDKFLGFAFNHYIMRDVTARQGRAPALQGYLYTHSCEIFRLHETGKERNLPTPAGISHGEAIFHLRSKFHKSQKGFISFIKRRATDGRPYGVAALTAETILRTNEKAEP